MEFNLPGTKQKIKETYKIVKETRNSFRIVKGAYDFASKKDPSTYEQMTHQMISLISKNPLGKITAKLYAAHFKALNDAITASQRQEPMDVYFKELLNNIRIFNSTYRESIIYKVDYSFLSTGPFAYLARLQRLNPDNSIEDLSATVTAAINFVKWLIHHEDQILFRYIPVIDNLVKLSALASKAIEHSISSAENIFEKAKSVFLRTGNALSGEYDQSTVTNLRDETKRNLNQILKNRNDWNNWLSYTPPNTWESYNVMANLTAHLKSQAH